MVARNPCGRSFRLIARAAPRTPSWRSWARRLIREETSAISEPEKKPLARMPTAISTISSQMVSMGWPSRRARAGASRPGAGPRLSRRAGRWPDHPPRAPGSLGQRCQMVLVASSHTCQHSSDSVHTRAPPRRGARSPSRPARERYPRCVGGGGRSMRPDATGWELLHHHSGCSSPRAYQGHHGTSSHQVGGGCQGHLGARLAEVGRTVQGGIDDPPPLAGLTLLNGEGQVLPVISFLGVVGLLALDPGNAERGGRPLLPCPAPECRRPHGASIPPGAGSVHSRHRRSSSVMVTGPTKRPMAPKVASPPRTPRKTRRNGTCVVPLMNHERITLSTVLTARIPHARSSRPATGRPWTRSHPLTGTYTIGAPNGMSARNVVAAPSSTGAPTPPS